MLQKSNYQLLISDESRLDILDASSWYESKKVHLGEDFEICLEAGFIQIQSDPFLFQKRYSEVHIYFIEKFPFGIHYLIEEQTIKIIGVFHMSRDPQQWIIRLDP